MSLELVHGVFLAAFVPLLLICSCYRNPNMKEMSDEIITLATKKFISIVNTRERRRFVVYSDGRIVCTLNEQGELGNTGDGLPIRLTIVDVCDMQQCPDGYVVKFSLSENGIGEGEVSAIVDCDRDTGAVIYDTIQIIP